MGSRRYSFGAKGVGEVVIGRVVKDRSSFVAETKRNKRKH